MTSARATPARRAAPLPLGPSPGQVRYGSDNSSGVILLSSTPGITVVVGFPFTASPESPCASETHGLFLAVNGRTSTAPSRPERGSLTLSTARIYPGSGNLLPIPGPVLGLEAIPSSSTGRCLFRHN